MHSTKIDIYQGFWDSKGMELMINKYIVADSNICHGKPTFVGTRVMVWQVLEMLASGTKEDEILQAFPALKTEHIKAALDYASSIMKKNYVVLNTEPPVPA